MKITPHSVVAFHYVLSDAYGEELDASASDRPLVYLHGAGNIVAGLERELEGRQPGDELSALVEPEDGYGPHHAELVQMMPHSMFEGADEVTIGMQFQAKGPGGQMQRVVVREIHADGVEVDANHPFAGRTLFFEVRIDSVRTATSAEIAAGRPLDQ
jgi:FKBP-type peptidyl-prolyl cis-trans isomerase SlyD